MRSWKLILKMFNHEGEGWQESSTEPMAWDYWKREWLVYQAPWIQDLREGLVASGVVVRYLPHRQRI